MLDKNLISESVSSYISRVSQSVDEQANVNLGIANPFQSCVELLFSDTIQVSKDFMPQHDTGVTGYITSTTLLK